MSDLRPTGEKIILGGKEYGLLFTNLVIDDIQDHFDISFDELGALLKDGRKIYKVLHYITASMINEYIDDKETGEPHVTAAFVGHKMNPANTVEIETIVAKAIRGGSPENGDDGPNPTSE